MCSKKQTHTAGRQQDRRRSSAPTQKATRFWAVRKRRMKAKATVQNALVNTNRNLSSIEERLRLQAAAPTSPRGRFLR